jgi:hypothetical protein
MATKLTLVSVKHGLQEWDAGWPARCVVGEDLPYLPTRWLFAVGNLVTTKASSYSQALFEIKVSFGESGQRTVLVTGTQMRTALRNLRVPGQDDADWDLVCAHDPVGRLGMLASSAAAVVLTRKVGWLAGALFAATVVAGLRARPRPSSAQCEAAATRLLTAACAYPGANTALGELLLMSPWQLSGQVESSIADFRMQARWMPNNVEHVSSVPWRWCWVSLRPSGIYFLPTDPTMSTHAPPLHVTLWDKKYSPVNHDLYRDRLCMYLGLRPLHWYKIDLEMSRERVQLRTVDDLSRMLVSRACDQCESESYCKRKRWCGAWNMEEGSLEFAAVAAPTYEVVASPEFMVRLGTGTEVGCRHLCVTVANDPALAAAFLMKITPQESLPQLWPHCLDQDPWFSREVMAHELISMIDRAAHSITLYSNELELFTWVSFVLLLLVFLNC